MTTDNTSTRVEHECWGCGETFWFSSGKDGSPCPNRCGNVLSLVDDVAVR